MRKGTSGTHYKAERKTKAFTIRLSESDLQMIRDKAELSGTSAADFIISACAGKRVPGYKKPEPIQDDNLPGQMDIMNYNFGEGEES